MKHLKILGLAAVTAAALTAFAGVSTASATVLCKTQLTTGCAASGWDYLVGTKIHLTQESEALTLKTTGGVTINECTSSTAKGVISQTGWSTSTVIAFQESWEWAGCTDTTHTIKVGSFEIHHLAGSDNGTLTLTSGVEWTMKTIFGTCVYGSGAALHFGTITGGNPATVDVDALVPKISGSFMCPNHGILKGSFSVTNPTPLYVSAV